MAMQARPKDPMGRWATGMFLMDDERIQSGQENLPNHEAGNAEARDARRLLVIRPGRMKSTCLRVVEYGEQATTRPDVWPYQEQHGIVYSDWTAPPPVRGETQLRESVRVALTEGVPPFSSCTRVDYGSIVEISNGASVRVLGKVTGQCIPVLLSNFREVHEDTGYSIGPSFQNIYHNIQELWSTLGAHRPSSRIGSFSGRTQLDESHSPVRSLCIIHGSGCIGVSSLLDTGAEVNFIAEHVVAQFVVQKRNYVGDPVVTANSVQIPIQSTVRLRWRFQGKVSTYEDDFLVVGGLEADVIIGYPTLLNRRFVILNCVLGFSKQQKEQQKKQEVEAAEKAKRNKEIEADRIQQKINRCTQGRADGDKQAQGGTSSSGETN